MGIFDSIGFGGIGGGFGGALGTFIIIMQWTIVGLVVFTGLGIWAWRKRQRQSFNIPLVIITPRSDGKVVEINEGVGGFFTSKRVGGISSFRIKRKGFKIVEIAPPSSDFLTSPNRILVLAQKGVEDYEPILPESLGMVTIPDGRRVAILKLKAINQEATAWAFDNEETAKRRFTFMSIWDKHQALITMMVFIFILFIIMYIQWIGMKDVVTGLNDVAQSLKAVVTPIITPS